MATKLFDSLNLTDGEVEFISNVLKDDKPVGVGSLYMQRAQILASLRLAKEIEKATSSNDKSANAMKCLTGALVFIGACQVAVAIINAVYKI